MRLRGYDLAQGRHGAADPLDEFDFGQQHDIWFQASKVIDIRT